MGADTLRDVNRSELRQLAQRAGLGHVGRDLSREDILDILLDGEELEIDQLSRWREAMERHIARNKARLRSQLPSCDGTCTAFGCPDLVVTRCWDMFRGDMV